MKTKTLTSEILLVFVTMIWGCAFVFQDLAMNYVRPFTFNVFRCLLGSIFLMLCCLGVFLFKRKRKKGSDKPVVRKKKDLILGWVLVGIATAVGMGCQQFGVSYEGSGKSGFITSLYIVFVPLLGIFFHKKISPLILIGIVFGVTGLYLINFDGSSFHFSIGTLCLLGCALGYAVQILLIDYFSPKCDSLQLTAGLFFVAGVLQIPFMLIFESVVWENILKAIWCILYCGILSTAVSFCLQIYTQQFIPVTIASMIMSLESVFSVIFGMLFLKEHYVALQFVGCVLIFAAVIVSQLNIPLKKKVPAGSDSK